MKTRSSCVILILTSLLFVGCAPRTADEFLARATALEAEGKVRDAIIQAKSAAQLDPKLANARWLLGRLLVTAGTGPAALKELEKGLELGVHPSDATVWLTRAYLLNERFEDIIDGKPVSAIAKLAPGVKLTDGVKAQVDVFTGHAYANVGKYDDANRLYNKVLDTYPTQAEALFGRGWVLVRQGKNSDAREWLNKALKANPKFAEAWRALGDLEFRAQHYAAAIAAFDAAANNRLDNESDIYMRFMARLLLPDLKAASADLALLEKQGVRKQWNRYARGLFEFNQKHYELARGKFQEAIAAAPNFGPAIIYLGITNVLLGDIQQALAQFKLAHAKEPNNSRVALTLASLELKQRNAVRARELAEEILKRDPKNPRALDVLGSALVALGDVKGGAELLRTIVEQDPNAADVRTKLGISLLSLGELDKGFSEIESAVKLADAKEPLYAVLISNYLQTGKHAEALRAVKELQAARPESATGWILEGATYLSQQDRPNAERVLKEGYKKFPGNPSLGVNLATLSLLSLKPMEARNYYEEVLKTNPGHETTMLMLSELDFEEGKYEPAKARLQELLKGNPASPRAALTMAKILSVTGELPRALKMTEDILTKNPDDSQALGFLGEGYLGTGNITRALSTLNKLVKITPNSADARYVNARALAASGQHKEAVVEATRAIQLKPTSANTFYGAVGLLIDGDTTEHASAALAASPFGALDNADVAALKGRIALARGKVDEAVSGLKASNAKYPGNRALILTLAQGQSRSKDNSAAIATLSEWLAKHQDDAIALTQRAVLYERTDALDKAADDYSEALKTLPNDAGTLNNLAWVLRDRNLGRALSYARRAEENAPNSPAVLDTLGSLLLKKGEVAQATTALEKANKAAPGMPEIQLHLAEANLKSGNKEAARKLLERVVKGTSPEASRAATAILSSM